MGNKVQLKSLRCPSCGANLKAENTTDAIDCVYCGNVIIPVVDTPQQTNFETHNISGTLKVEGIKTSSSALAYLEQLFEEYDWETFSYANNINIREIDKLAESLRNTSADDKNTWIVYFKTIYVPYICKLDGCKKILDTAIAEYKNSNLDSYSKFDAYERIATLLNLKKPEVILKLEKAKNNAQKYGADAEEINEMANSIANLASSAELYVFGSIEAIPEIQRFNSEKNAAIASDLFFNKGINADEAYNQALSLMSQGEYFDALNILKTLNGYLDSEALIEKADQYFLVGNALEVGGKLYYCAKLAESSALYPSENNKVSHTPIITNIKKIITNYANILYYFNTENTLIRFNLQTKERIKFKENFKTDTIHLYNGRLFLLTYDNNLHGIELSNGTAITITSDVNKIISATNGKLVYTTVAKGEQKSTTNIFDIDTGIFTCLGEDQINVEGFWNHLVIFTTPSPNIYNYNLFVKILGDNSPAYLIERNIYQFKGTMANRLFYYIGNARNKTLINVNFDGSMRKEWPLFVGELLFEQGGWLYFTRRSGYNSVLCKAKPDGSDYCVIASDIDQFVELKNGYLYYLNDDASLIKVRMDGSNYQELCTNVEEVLHVKENKIVVVSIDNTTAWGGISGYTDPVKSIYAVDFLGSGKSKLLYNVKNVKKYDDNSVYCIMTEKQEPTTPEGAITSLDVLYKLDINTGNTEKLLDLKVSEAPPSSNIGIAIAFLVLFIVLFIIAISCESVGFSVFSFFGALISAIVIIAKKATKSS